MKEESFLNTFREFGITLVGNPTLDYTKAELGVCQNQKSQELALNIISLKTGTVQAESLQENV